MPSKAPNIICPACSVFIYSEAFEAMREALQSALDFNATCIPRELPLHCIKQLQAALALAEKDA